MVTCLARPLGRGGRLGVKLENARPAAVAGDGPGQLVGPGSQPLDEPVLKVDPGLAALLDEANLDLTRVREVRVILELRVELPGHDQPARRLVDQDLAPVAFGAIYPAL